MASYGTCSRDHHCRMRCQADSEPSPRGEPTIIELELAGDQVRYFRREAAIRDTPLDRLLRNLLGAICDDRIAGAVPDD
jgi:hypothetical protein